MYCLQIYAVIAEIFKFENEVSKIIEQIRWLIVVYSVPNYPGRSAKSKMAANKVRENVTSSLTSGGARDDVMVVQEAHCGVVPFWWGAMASAGGIRQQRADEMVA